MTTIDEAILILKSLPAEQQEAAIDIIMDLAAQSDDLHLTDAQVAEIERRLNCPDTDLMSLDEFVARVDKLGAS